MRYNLFVETTQLMTRLKMTDDQLIDSLKDLYGESVTSADIKAWCAMNSMSYQTVSRRLANYKTGHGKWNLEVTNETVQDLEVTYNSPAAMPAIKQNLIPQKDDSFILSLIHI